MRYSKSMIEAVQQVGLYEMMDYAIIDGDNKIIGLYKGNMAKKQAQLNMKGAERQVGIKKPLKVIPVSKKKKGDTVIGIGELTDKQRGEIEEGKIEFKQDSKDVISIMKKGKLQGKMKKTPKGWAVVRGGRDFPITGGKNLDVAKDAVRDLFGEETLHEDRKNALAGFDNRIRDGGMDRKDFIKAKELYKRKDVKGLRKHIYSLDTSPLEVVMNLISIQDRPFFDKMYPNTRGGEFLARIAYQHRHLDENIDENKDDEKKRMKGAKLKLKMGESLDEAVADLFVKKGDVNQIAVKIAKSAKGLGLKSGVMGNQVRVKGAKREVNDFMRSVLGKSSMGSPSEVGGTANPQIDKMLNKQLKKETINELKEPFIVVDTANNNKVVGTASHEKGAKEIIVTSELPPMRIKNKKTLKIVKTRKKQMIGQPLQEDGHTDVSSAIRQCKTVLEDAMQIMGKLKSMSGEDSLPTWWTNKLAVASNSMNKIRDYLLVPSDGMNEQLQEAMGDMEDLKKVVAELQNASKMHLAQSKRVQAHVDMMKDAGMDKNDVPKKEETITSKDLLDNKFKEEKNGAQHFSKIEEDNYVWNFVYDDFGRTKLTTEPDKATHLVYTMEGKDNPQLLKISEKEILDYKKGETNEVSKK